MPPKKNNSKSTFKASKREVIGAYDEDLLVDVENPINGRPEDDPDYSLVDPLAAEETRMETAVMNSIHMGNERLAEMTEETGSVEFVCFFCEPLPSDYRPIVKVQYVQYGDQDRFIEYNLTRSSQHHQLYTCTFRVSEHDEWIRLRVAVYTSPGTASLPNEENVVYHYWKKNNLYRHYACMHIAKNAMCVAIVRDKFSRRSSCGNAPCTDLAVVKAWIRVLGWQIHNFSNLSVSDFIGAINQVSYCSEDQVRADRLNFTLSQLFDTNHRVLAFDIPYLLKWIPLMDKLISATKITLSIDGIALNQLEGMDLQEVYLSVNEVSEPSFQKCATSFFSKLAESGAERYRVKWAMLRIALSPSNTYAAENIVKIQREVAAKYLALFQLPTVSTESRIKVFSLFRKFRAFRDNLPAVEDFFLPCEVIFNITNASDYNIPTYDHLALEEYQALGSFILGSEEALLRCGEIKHFRVNSHALLGLTYFEKAVVAVLPIVRKFSTCNFSVENSLRVAPVVEQRCRELRELLQADTMNADQEFVQNIYGIVRELHCFVEVPGVRSAIQDLMTALPATDGAGLCHRFEAFLCEPSTHAYIVELEDKALKAVCRREGNNSFSMRKAFWNKMCRVIKTDDRAAWHRGFGILAELWDECYSRATVDKLSILTGSERHELSSLGFAASGNDAALSYLLIESVRDLHQTFEAELRQHPELLNTHSGSYSSVHQHIIQYTIDRVQGLAQTLSTQRLRASTLQTIMKHSSLYTCICTIVPSFDQAVIEHAAVKVTTIRQELNNLVEIFRNHMPRHPRFKASGSAFIAEVEAESAKLENALVCDWQPPTLGGSGGTEIVRIATQLSQAQGSLLYAWVWTRQCDSENKTLNTTAGSTDAVAATANANANANSMEQWKTSVEASLAKWTETIALIESGQFLSVDLQEAFLPVLEFIPECPQIPNNPIEAEQVAERYQLHVLEHLERNVASEASITAKVLKISPDELRELMLEFLSALTLKNHVTALEKLVSALHCPCDPQEDPLYQFLRSLSTEGNTVQEVISSYNAFARKYPQATNVVVGFPHLLVQAIEEGLPQLFSTCSDIPTLDQVVRRKVGEAAGQREQMLLMALLETRKAMENLSVPTGFASLVSLQFPSVANLLAYLASVSWCSAWMRQMLGGVAMLTELLQGGSSVASTVALVHALIGTGEFRLTVQKLNVQLTATALVDKDGVLSKRSFGNLELSDIPFKLCMVGVQKSAEEMNIQRHFLQVMEQLKVLCQTLLTLSVSGHPNFQDCSLVVRGSVSVDELRELIREQTHTHINWQNFLSGYADVHLPLLTCLSRTQLVESLRYFGRPDNTLATVNLVRSVCSAMSISAATQLVQRVQTLIPPDQVFSSREIFSQVHELLLSAVHHFIPYERPCPSRLEAQVKTFKDMLPEKLKNPVNVNVLKLPSSYAVKHNEIVCGLFIVLKSRLPAPIEVFCCSAQTTEQACTDFIRRWSASQYFKEMLLEETSELMFCMMNVELLTPRVQSVLLTQIHNLKKAVAVPILLVVSIDQDAQSLLSSGLRDDWVIFSSISQCDKTCRDLCTSYLQKGDHKFVYVYHSDAPSSGKTTAILRDHAVSKDGANRTIYAMVSTTGDADEAVEALRVVERDRRFVVANSGDASDGGIVLHINISSHFDVQKLNAFIMQYCVLGVLTNSSGDCVIRNPTDVVVIEWPSEGILAENVWKKCQLISCFRRRPPRRTFDLHTYDFHPYLLDNNDSVLYHVSSHEDPSLRTGIKMALAFFTALNEKAFDGIPYYEDVVDIPVPSGEELFEIFSAQTMNRGDTAPPPVGQVYRFARFLTHQMYGLTQFPYYQWASRENEQNEQNDRVRGCEHCRNYRRLVFHLARCSLQLARRLAASAVAPLTTDTDDDSRLGSLQFSFDQWRDMPFLTFSADGEFQVISVSDSSSMLRTMTADDNDTNFKQFIQNHTQRETTTARSMVDMVTSGLTENEYDPASCTKDRHALKVLLPMISEVPKYSMLIFHALQDEALRAAPDTTIADMIHHEVAGEIVAYHKSAVEQLRSYMGEEMLLDAHTFADFQEVARQWFLKMTGSYSGHRAPFVLTKDNLIRLLTIKMRLVCRIPVVFVGETGCGKTHLVHFLSQISGLIMETYNIYGGIKPSDLLAEMQGIVNRAAGREVVVLLDEINSNSNVWMIKELVCDRCVLGRRVPNNVRFICIMNPRRLRNSLTVPAESHGLDYSPYRRITHHIESIPTDNASSVSPSDSGAPLLVYEVYRSPESLMSLVWDFGMPSESFKHPEEALRICHNRTHFPAEFSRFISDELIFTENMVHWMITARLKDFKCGESILDDYGEDQDIGLSVDFSRCSGDHDGTSRHLPYLRALLTALIDTSQRYMRTEQGLKDKSAASLRDISRVVSLIPFLMDLQVRYAEYYRPPPEEREYMYFKFLSIAVQASLVLNYALRIVNDRQRDVYLQTIYGVWKQIRASRVVNPEFLSLPLEPQYIYNAFDGLAAKLCSALLLPKGIAINQALKENVLSLFCAVMGDDDTGIFQFIVGRPGSTKSSSLDILCASTDPSSQDPRTAFFRRKGWYSVSKFLLQCTPDTTAQDIMKVAQTAANAQRLKPTWRCIIVLEEVGVTLGSKHNPLMVLHGLIDRGVPMDDGTFVKLPIIGISNWQLDGSKMSRMRTTYRGNPTVEDLVKTAGCIMEIAATRTCAVSAESLRRFARVFRNKVLSGTNKELAWFYGMRDFYAFIQFLQIHHSYRLTKELKIQEWGLPEDGHLDPHLVQWAVKISFGGHPNQQQDDQVFEEILSCFASPSELQTTRWARQIAHSPQQQHLRASENEASTVQPHLGADALCDMCARIAHYVDKKQCAATIRDLSDQAHLFRTHFREYNTINSRCTQLESGNSFPVVSILSYCLNVFPTHIAMKYRVRHVLLFTRANAGLRLLFSLGIVNKQDSHIIFGRANATETEKLDDLLMVRRCMQNGKVLILVGAHHISESLYDALNQHYITEGKGENRVELTRLTMNGYTASFPIHSSFRCISVEQEDTCRQLLPPYINRFTKAHLNYSSALSAVQANVARSIRAKSSVIFDEENPVEIDLLLLLIPGLSKDTIDSLAFLVNVDKARLPLDKAVKFCCDLLSFLIVPRRLQQLLCGMYETLNGALIIEKITYWNELMSCREHSLAEDYAEIQRLRIEKLSKEAYHLCLFTEQVQVLQQDVQDAIQELFPYCEPLPWLGEFVNLNEATDRQVQQLLSQLSEAEDNCFCIAYFSTNPTERNRASLLVDRFMHMVSAEELPPNKHIVLIGVLTNSSQPGKIRDDFQLHFDPNWNFMFIDEICVSHDAPVALCDLLSKDEGNYLERVISPSVLCYCIIRRALSIAQYVERRDGDACTDLAMLLTQVFSNEDDPIALAICNKMMHNLQFVEEVKGGNWRKLALQKIKHAHSLTEQLLLFLVEFVQRAVLQFSTELFSFKNFATHCRADSDTRMLFLSLLESDLIIPDRSLHSCALVDLPIVSESLRISELPTHTDTFFHDTSMPVAFPFSFLVANILHPVARASGIEACKLKCAELLHTTDLPPELALRYKADILAHVLQLTDIQVQNAFFFVTRVLLQQENIGSAAVASVVAGADSMVELLDRDGEWVDVIGAEEMKLDRETHADEVQGEKRNDAGDEGEKDNVNLQCIEVLHMLLIERSQWIEAIIRLITLPQFSQRLQAAMEINTHTNNTSILKLLLSASSLSSGIVPLNVLSDIAIVIGQSNLLLQLHHTISIATAQESDEEQTRAVELIQRVETAETISEMPLQPLENAFLSGDPVSIKWSKFLLPVIFKANEQDPGRLLNVLVECLINQYSRLPRPASGIIIKKSLEWWLKGSDDPTEAAQRSRLTALLIACISRHGGSNSDFSVLISRCIFDICDAADTTLSVLRRVLHMDEDLALLRLILLAGSVTGALYIQCHALKMEIIREDAEDEEGGREDMNEVHIAIMRQLTTETEKTLLQYSDLIPGATLFALRLLSSGGVESETAKRAVGLQKYLPKVILDHRLSVGMLREAEDSALSMHAFPGYTRAILILEQECTRSDDPGPVDPVILQEFFELRTVGKATALLDIGFCWAGTPRALSAKQLDHLKKYFLPTLPTENNLLKICTVLLQPELTLSPSLPELSPEHRRLLSITAVLIIKGNSPLFKFYLGIVTRNPESAPVVASKEVKEMTPHASISRLLLFTAELLYIISNATSIAPTVADIAAHTDHIVHNIITQRCPRCKGAFGEFTGCFALQCLCGCRFCAWCFKVYPANQLHGHVKQCVESLNPNSYFGTHEQFIQKCRQRQLKAAKEYFATSIADVAKGPVLDAVIEEFNKFMIPVDTLVSSVGHTMKCCIHDISEAIANIKSVLFATALMEDTAMKWIEALMLLQLVHSKANCADQQQAVQVVQEVIQQTPDVNNLIETLKIQCQEAFGAVLELSASLCWSQNYTETINLLSQAEIEKQLPFHFARRTRATAQMFWNKVKQDKELSILGFLGLREESLSRQCGVDMVIVLNYVGELMRICSAQQITRLRAATLTLSELAESTVSIGGEKLNRFCEALCSMYERVERWECCDKKKLNSLFGHLQFDGSIPLIYLLPQSRDEGLLIHTLYNGSADPMRDDNWKSIGLGQNPVVQEMVDKFRAPVRSATHRPYALTYDDLVIFDKSSLVYQHLLSLYIDPLPTVEFTKDLVNLQWQVVRSATVWGKPLLAPTLPDFLFIEDQKSSVFGKLASVVDKYGGVLPLRKDISKRLGDLIERQHHNRDNLIAYLIILATELISRPSYQIPYYLTGLAELIPVTLTDAQLEGKSLLSDHCFANTLQPQHILSLVEPLWDGSLCPKCCIPLDDETSAQVEAVFDGIVSDPRTVPYAPQLRYAFRMLGLQKLCVEQPAGYYSYGFIDMLETMEVDPDFPWDELLRDNIVGQITTQHFEAVYRIADRILSSVMVGVSVNSAFVGEGIGDGDNDVDLADGRSRGFEVKIEDLRSLFKTVPMHAHSEIVVVRHRNQTKTQPTQAASSIAAESVPSTDGVTATAEGEGGCSADTRTNVYRWEGQGMVIDLDI